MKLKLKENPNEWRKFALVWCVAFSIVAFLLARKGVVPWTVFKAVAGAFSVAAVLALAAPRLFRGVYRAGMTGSFYVGQFMGKVILTVVFWIAVVPLSLCLRLAGKDLLRLKRDPKQESYWNEPRRGGTFEQQF